MRLLATYSNIVLLVVCMLGLMVLGACGAQDEGESSKANETSRMDTTIIGGRTGGAWSVFTEGIAESIRREYEDAIITVEPGGIVENSPTVDVGNISYGLSYAMTAFAAYSGTEPYDQPYESIRAVSVVIPANYYQFIMREDSGYNSLDDIVENQVPLRLAVDQKGSAGEIITRNILQQYGVTYEDIISWGGSVDHLGDSKAFELMKDKRIDATGDAVSVPSSNIIEASTTMDLTLLDLKQETIQAVSEELGMVSGTIPSGSYDFLGRDIDTVNTPAILLVHKDVSEAEVYQVTQAIYKNLDYLGTVHEEFSHLTDENIMDVGSVPLHPGAAKFFKEQGLTD
ncbi:TAXI family TRAP transporter solute-binding subunit [Virgibacillus byunsanensis]|uniref:TAXI family TRAP transporter solute-binding subunit n=1 Tax=Virgibacillus byunsanensis TaxID=570945 RepID=A0ABW3LR40_9BACI